MKQINFGNAQGINYNLKQVIPTHTNIQLTTENGLLVYNRDLELIDSFRINTREEAITSIFKDKRNNMWLVTAGDGLKFVDNYYRTTSTIVRPERTAIEFSDNKIYTVNAKGDIIVMDDKGRTLASIPVSNFSNTQRNFRNVYLLNTGKGTLIATPKNVSLANGIKSADYVGKAEVGRTEWLQSLKGMCYSANKVYLLLFSGIHVVNEKQELSKVAGGRFTKMAVLNDGSPWAADNNRLYRLRKGQDGQWATEEFHFSDDGLHSLSEPGNMQADEYGNLLLTYDHYFVCYNAQENKTTYSRYENRVKGSRLCGNKFFVYTDGYIDYYVINKTTSVYQRENRFYNFDYSLYEEVKGLTASDSNLYISNTTGIVITPLQNRFIPDSDFIGKTFVSSVTHRDKVYNRTDTANGIGLRYTRGQTVFHISGMSLSYGRDVSYRYFLEGLDEKWQTGASANITYTGLPAGHYVFHFFAQAGKYDLRGTEQTFMVDIDPLWWQRGELQISALLLLLGAGFWGVSRYIIARKNKQLEHVLIEKQISDVRLGTLQSQMNPHFVFNVLTSVQSFLKQEKNELAADYLLKFTQLIRLFLEFSRKRFISFAEEVRALQLYTGLESQRFNNRFVVKYKLEGIRGGAEILIPPLIIQPFVENAIIHGLYHRTAPGGILLLDFSLEGNRLTVVIDDNGIGRKKAEEINKHYAKVPSRGNEIVNERIKIFASQKIMQIDELVEDKTDSDGNPAGTRVTIVFFIKPNPR